MKRYKVIIGFLDDNDPDSMCYWPGENYPRAGYEPTAERLAYLQGSKNTFGKPVIANKPLPEPKKKESKK